MDITIRKVSIDDAYDFALNHITCWQDAYKGIIPEDYLDNMSSELEQRAEKNRQILANPGDCEYCCVELNGEMIGRLVFGKSHDEDKSDAGEVHAIYLLAPFWGNGYGKQMLIYALAELKQAGYKEATIWVFKENIRGRQFYEKHGFVLDGKEMELVCGKSLKCLRYTLDLR